MGAHGVAFPPESDAPVYKQELKKIGRHDNDSAAQWIRDSGAKYLRVYWHDYSSSARCRVVPIDRVWEAFERGHAQRSPEPFTLSIVKACLGALPSDAMIPGTIGTGMYRLQPDWGTLRQGPAPGHISCRGWFLEWDNSITTLCPRGVLKRAIDRAAATEGLTFLVGFEIEFILLEPTGDDEKFRMISRDGHNWSMARPLASWGAEGSIGTIIGKILEQLEDANISVEQFHPESAPGQFEIVLSPLAPLLACDTLLHARQVIESVAARHGLRVTLHPRPFPTLIGNGAHAHMSINSQDGNQPRVYERFYGGILKHFPAVFALTDSHPASYDRMVDGLWAGGRWVTWGVDNKETPLRKCAASHWEVKVMDGIANPYLAMAALISAGTAGADEFTWGDCKVDPAKLSSEERAALGITTEFPRTLEEALVALESDSVMIELLGKDVVERYVTVKRAEMALLESIPEDKRLAWVLERY
ncbi:hypothetical protein GGR51DRAFT_167895 [Nemania sp. FL0031]|nr:hypothetical protein GGR51DRAFT_167895 [Nemania sp. FL0031]